MNKTLRMIIISIALILNTLIINQMKYRNDELYAVTIKNKVDNDLVSILVNDGSESYTKYEGSTFPSNTEYTYNSELSKCQDNNGNVIEGILSYDETTGKVNIRTKKTTYCYLYFDKMPGGVEITGNIAQGLIDSNTLWQSGLEGDGYRYTGTSVMCSYNNKKYIEPADNQDTTPSCPTLYNYTRITVSSGSTYNATYQTSCPSNTSTYTYNCTELNATLDESGIPNNFICFGTTSLTECKANEEKYMYRIIGVFPDDTREQHLKLIKYKQLPKAYKWHSYAYADVSWEESDLFKGLNGISGGSYSNLFIGNTTYDYLQDATWLNKIADWKWTAVNTFTIDNSGYANHGPDYFSLITDQMYLHEMNRSTKTSTVGIWEYPTAKIGLMYASDYMMSLGSSSLTIASASQSTLKTCWLYSDFDWLISRRGNDGGVYFAWDVEKEHGRVSYRSVGGSSGVSPAFYLESNVKTSGGTGSYSNPYLIVN